MYICECLFVRGVEREIHQSLFFENLWCLRTPMARTPKVPGVSSVGTSAWTPEGVVKVQQNRWEGHTEVVGYPGLKDSWRWGRQKPEDIVSHRFSPHLLSGYYLMPSPLKVSARKDDCRDLRSKTPAVYQYSHEVSNGLKDVKKKKRKSTKTNKDKPTCLAATNFQFLAKCRRGAQVVQLASYYLVPGLIPTSVDHYYLTWQSRHACIGDVFGRGKAPPGSNDS